MSKDDQRKQQDFEKVDRGDIVLINFEPQSGKEIKGNRYALILSPNLFNANTGFVSLCPITNTKRGFGYEIEIPESMVSIQKKDGEEYLTGVILTHQLKNLDARSKRLMIVGKMQEDIMDTCLDYVNTYLSS
ncbi:type II toxin-antitoxin system PemK/MazF family toxin [Oceanobacillus locisalsi]|uniref:Type II toxin-antitoxin system PemK/MazF family toxin n=1 Tax=Oceanobacillus locisalsi TaxID=546107 RepID=A0ABW3NAW7_9BACI